MNTNKYRVLQIERTDKKGQKERKAVCIEVDDIETFRKKMRGRKYADVKFVYEEIN